MGQQKCSTAASDCDFLNLCRNADRHLKLHPEHMWPWLLLCGENRTNSCTKEPAFQNLRANCLLYCLVCNFEAKKRFRRAEGQLSRPFCAESVNCPFPNSTNCIISEKSRLRRVCPKKSGKGRTSLEGEQRILGKAVGVCWRELTFQEPEGSSNKTEMAPRLVRLRVCGLRMSGSASQVFDKSHLRSARQHGYSRMSRH